MPVIIKKLNIEANSIFLFLTLSHFPNKIIIELLYIINYTFFLLLIMSEDNVTIIHGYVQQMENAMLDQKWDNKFSLGFVCPYLKGGSFIEKCFHDHGFDVYTLDLYELRWRFSNNIEKEILREIDTIQSKIADKEQPMIFIERLDGVQSKHHVHLLPWFRDGIKTVNAQGQEVFVPVIVHSREYFGSAFEKAFTNECTIQMFDRSVDNSIPLERLHEKRRLRKDQEMEELYKLDADAHETSKNKITI
jgi:hypothetical protein